VEVEGGVGADRGSVNLCMKSSSLYSSSGGEMDTVIFVGRVVLVLDLWDSTEGRVTLVKVELVGATAWECR